MRTSVWLLLFAAACSSSPARNGNHDGGTGNPGHDGGGPPPPGPPETHDVVDPSLPAGIVAGFDSATPSAGGLTVVYPASGVILPHDLAPIDVQWNAASGATAYRVTYAVPTGDRLRGYVKSADWT